MQMQPILEGGSTSPRATSDLPQHQGVRRAQQSHTGQTRQPQRVMSMILRGGPTHTDLDENLVYLGGRSSHGDRTCGGRPIWSVMKCITWNLWGLRDDRRRDIVGQYLREWGADVICLQETMVTHLEQQTWTSLGWGSGEAYVSIPASGRSGGTMLA